MSKIRISKRVLAIILALMIPLSGLAFTALADPGIDDLVSLASLSKSGDGVAEWSQTYAHGGSWSIHLTAPDKATWNETLGMGEGVNEGRITLKLAPGTNLGDIETIEWWVRTVSGYPPHVDLLLDIDDNGTYDGGRKDLVTGATLTGEDDALVAEFAYQPYVGPGYLYSSPGVPYGHYDPSLQGSYYDPTYDTWVRTFQNGTAETGTTQVFNDTVCWLYSGLPGPYAAYDGGYFGKLEDFKMGTVNVIGGTDEAPVDKDTVVLEIQIEVDNWLGPAEAYVDDVLLNGESLLSELTPPEIEVIKPEEKTYEHVNIPVKISTYDLFGVSSVWFNAKKDGGGWVYTVNRTYTQPTVMQYLPVGDYTFYAWAENELGVVGEDSTRFSVRATALSVDVNPDTLNLRSRGRWVTVRITPPSGRTTGEIDIGSLRIRVGDESVPASWGKVQDGVLMVKFDRASLQEIVEPGEEVELKLTGSYTDGTSFEGSDAIRVINPGRQGHGSLDRPQKSDNRGRGRGLGKG